MKILFSPAHYIFSDKRGSEYSWSYNIIDKISEYYKNQSIVITGLNETKKEYKIISIYKDKTFISMPYNALFFNLNCFLHSMITIKTNKIDIVHHCLPYSFGYTFNLISLFLKKEKFIIGPIQMQLEGIEEDFNLHFNKKISFIIHKSKLALASIFQRAASPLLFFLAILTLKRADKIVVINKATYNHFLPYVDKKNIVIIPVGIAREKFNLKKEIKKDLVLFTASSLIKRKRIDLIIQSFSEIVKRYKKTKLIIVGDGPQRKNLELLVKELNIEKYVTFEGFVPNNLISKYYEKGDIYLSMSESESWGQVYLEAMSAGLPIISTKNIGSNEIVIAGKTGFLIEKGDCTGLTKGIIKLLKNRTMLKSFSENARILLEEKYYWDKIIPRYIKIYEDLMNET